MEYGTWTGRKNVKRDEIDTAIDNSGAVTGFGWRRRDGSIKIVQIPYWMGATISSILHLFRIRPN